MIERSIDQVTAEDLQRLVANGVSEGVTLEFKETLPGSTDSERKEFLADASSFANSSDGDLIYGVREHRDAGRPTGIPEAIEGLDGVNTDAEIQRLENMLRDGIAPRIHGIRIRSIASFTRGAALIVRVPRSWSGPHMVTYQQHSRFYSRNASGKYALDVFELRNAFLRSGSLSERAREFRTERIGRLIASETPVLLNSSKLVCVHVISHAALAGASEIDLVRAANQHDHVQPFYSQGRSLTFNIDGFLTFSQGVGHANAAYLQLFRNGIIETVNSELTPGLPGERDMIPSLTFADELAKFLNHARALLRALEVEPPVSVFVTLIGIKGAVLGVGQRLALRGGLRAFDRDTILLPEILLQEFEGDMRHLLKPMLNALWQAAGMARCFDYDDAGNWNPSPS